MPKLCELTARETTSRIRSGEATAEECVRSVLERIHEVEDRVHAFITILEKDAVNQARRIDAKLRQGKSLGKLAGVSIAVKDSICTKGVRTTCASRMLKNFLPPYDAHVVERIKREDGIIIGKTNMDEFSMGSSTETSFFGPTHNPWDLARVPGGSSGGSAAAVVANEAILALGADTGGSIRCPASYCATVGLKPTYGLVSRYGLIAYANSLEQIGPITKDSYDCALFLSIIANRDSRDSTSVKAPSNEYTNAFSTSIEGSKIGVPSELLGEGTHRKVQKQIWKAADTLQKIGADCEETSISSLQYALAAYYIIAMSEASSNLARYDGLRYGYRLDEDGAAWTEVYSKSRQTGFGPEVKRRIILGTFALSTGYYDKYYLKALKVRTLIRRGFDEAFKRFDALIGPAMPLLPFPLGERNQDPLTLYMCDVDTVSVNLAGLPAVSIPCGFSEGLPVGMQIIAPPLAEKRILRIAYAFEQRTRDTRSKSPLA